jgi:diguanylate cyclase (GGDEF)-like protein/PAS domain S-box-containing protein
MGWTINLPGIDQANDDPDIERLVAYQTRIIDQIYDAVIVTDVDGKITNWNCGAEMLFGYSSDEICGQDIYILFPSIKPYEIFQDEYIEYLQKKGFDEYEATMKRKDGKSIYVGTSASLLTNDAGEVDGVISYTKDISERKNIEEKHKKNMERYKILYNDTPTMFFSLSHTGEILNVNNYGATQLGYTIEELIGKHLLDITHTDEKDNVMDNLKTCVKNKDKVQRWESIKICKSGSFINVRETGHMVWDEDTGDKTILLVCEDITKAKILHEQLSYQASHDTLTSLINRKEFNHRLQIAIETAHSDKTRHALCYLDLDQFKIINDTCGHVAGDNLLKQLSQVMQNQVSKRDILARLGGDEFGLLLMYCESEWAMGVIRKLHATIENFVFQWEAKSFRVGASIGIAFINDSTEDIEEILKKADAACFAAKDAGRNRIHVYKDDDIEMARRRGEIQWVNRIHIAFEKNLFSLNVQEITPICVRDDGDHYEVLIRMTGEKGEAIPPGAFLPAAERYNLASKIDRWVIQETFQWLLEHPDRLDQLALCSINLSGNSLCDKEFLEYVVCTLETTKIPPSKICFEITETAAIANLSAATEFITKIKAFGCLFALDDFGSGLSSFAYLKNLPVDILKIDGLFVKDIAKDSIDYAMVKSINEIGHVMGKQTVAEFVEDKEIYNKLKEIGVDYAQGYYFSKPHPIDDLETLAEVI